MVRSDCTLKILDFGLARSAGTATTLTDVVVVVQMVLILDAILEIGVHAWNDIGKLIDFRKDFSEDVGCK